MLESHDAFIAPHIVISAAPAEDLWVAWMNGPSEQTSAWLTVPNLPVVNQSWMEKQDLATRDVLEYSSSEDEDPEIETPRPGSPLTLDEELEMEEHFERFLDTIYEDEYKSEFAHSLADLESPPGESPWDEDEDLPELDEWYLDIAQRTGVHLA